MHVLAVIVWKWGHLLARARFRCRCITDIHYYSKTVMPMCVCVCACLLWMTSQVCFLSSHEQKDHSDTCNFKEVFLENFYTAYSSEKLTQNGKEMFISLSQKGRPLRGKKTRKESIASHFIPRKCKEDDKTRAWHTDTQPYSTNTVPAQASELSAVLWTNSVSMSNFWTDIFGFDPLW